jgi:PAS domain S-box-containing protein
MRPTHMERNQILETLREREAGLNRAQLVAQLAHVVTGPGGAFETWSETLPTMIGRTPDNMIRSTRAWLEIVHAEDRERFRQTCIEAAQSRRRTDVDYRLYRADGAIVAVHQVMEPLDNLDARSQPTRWFNTIQDVTGPKRAEDEIRRLNADLERRVAERTEELSKAYKELEAFSATVSHDLRAPLTKIHGFAQILLEDCGDKLDPDNLRHLQAISKNATTMAQLIEDLLAFSRTGRKPIDAMQIDMSAMAADVAAELAGDAAIAARVRIAPLPAAWGDPVLLRQVWINLLGNALKYSGRVANPRVAVSGSTDGGECIYKVDDNGAGFDMRYAAKLFEPFQRLHSAAEFPGTGIGLAIVQRIVTRHGGRVWAEGKEGEGATFYFALPARRD